ncbi:MAG: M23 family metallopeptidase [Gammaproteobacteria bacterium]
MNLILFVKQGRLRQLDLGKPKIVVGIAALGVLAGATLFLAGFGMANWFAQPSNHVLALKAQFSSQAREVTLAKQAAQANIDALSAKVSALQAHIMRLDALGQQLTRMAGLKKGEFDFSAPPAEGGPEVSGPVQHVALPDFLDSLDQLSAQINNREQQLTVLESLLMNRNVQLQARPSGPPVVEGYESSPFGMRIDPFTGELSFHPGIDFAGPEGEAVKAVAAGVVTWAGPRSGYGNMVEIDHGNGYATLYGHSEKVLVHVGEVVKKGQEIALLGSTGRSTGPHVHFEVLYNGKPVNPAQFVNASGRLRVAAMPRSLD